VEIPQMLLPLLLATALLLAGLLVYGAAMQLIVSVIVKVFRRDRSGLGIWQGIALMSVLTLITAVAHLTQVGLWAVAFLLCGQVSTVEAAFCLSAQNYTAFGYGDVPVSERWRLLCPLEAAIGLLFFGISTAVLFAIMNQLIADRLRMYPGYHTEAIGKRIPPPLAGDAWSR
jgi:hypothetical protein